jgi:hypothetical protein
MSARGWRPLLRVPVLVLFLSSSVAAAPARVVDLDGREIDPLAPRTGVRATVLLFVSSECPISNRYAPDVRRLHEAFAAQGVRFWLVYPNAFESADAIRRHVRDFGLPASPLRDPVRRLVRAAAVTVTPEAAVFDAQGALVYRGRIDDRYTEVGVDRQVPTRRDLEEALEAAVAGRPVRTPNTRAVGCFLADLP